MTLVVHWLALDMCEINLHEHLLPLKSCYDHFRFKHTTQHDVRFGRSHRRDLFNSIVGIIVDKPYLEVHEAHIFVYTIPHQWGRTVWRYSVCDKFLDGISVI